MAKVEPIELRYFYKPGIWVSLHKMLLLTLTPLLNLIHASVICFVLFCFGFFQRNGPRTVVEQSVLISWIRFSSWTNLTGSSRISCATGVTGKVGYYSIVIITSITNSNDITNFENKKKMWKCERAFSVCFDFDIGAILLKRKYFCAGNFDYGGRQFYCEGRKFYCGGNITVMKIGNKMVISLSLYLSLSVSVSVCLCLYLSLYLSLSVSPFLSLSLYLSLSLSPSLPPSLYLFLPPPSLSPPNSPTIDSQVSGSPDAATATSQKSMRSSMTWPTSHRPWTSCYVTSATSAQVSDQFLSFTT